MKTKTIIAITCLSYFQLCSNSANIAANPSKTLESSFCKTTIKSSITAGDIITYLQGLGYTVDGYPTQKSLTWTCKTHLGYTAYMTTTYTDGANIITHEDMQI